MIKNNQHTIYIRIFISNTKFLSILIIKILNYLFIN